MKGKQYEKPCSMMKNPHVRTSILTGSDSGVFNGTSGGTTTGKDFTFEAKKREANSNID